MKTPRKSVHSRTRARTRTHVRRPSRDADHVPNPSQNAYIAEKRGCRENFYDVVEIDRMFGTDVRVVRKNVGEAEAERLVHARENELHARRGARRASAVRDPESGEDRMNSATEYGFSIHYEPAKDRVFPWVIRREGRTLERARNEREAVNRMNEFVQAKKISMSESLVVGLPRRRDPMHQKNLPFKQDVEFIRAFYGTGMRPVTAKARAWFKKNLKGATKVGGWVAVENRYVDNIIFGMERDGLWTGATKNK